MPTLAFRFKNRCQIAPTSKPSLRLSIPNNLERELKNWWATLIFRLRPGPLAKLTIVHLLVDHRLKSKFIYLATCIRKLFCQCVAWQPYCIFPCPSAQSLQQLLVLKFTTIILKLFLNDQSEPVVAKVAPESNEDLYGKYDNLPMEGTAVIKKGCLMIWASTGLGLWSPGY